MWSTLGGRGRRLGWIALFVAPVVAAAVVALATASTYGQFTASITNNNNHVQAGSVGLVEHHDDEECTAPGNGQWTDCDNINKYGGGSLTSDSSTGPQTVTLTNSGSVAASLFFLPSACSDSLTGANGRLCDLVTVRVTCPSAAVGPVTLNALFTGRNFPTGYAMGSIAAGATITCTFNLTAGTIPAPGGTISQPLSWRLTAVP